jgi:hypothetical protein
MSESDPKGTPASSGGTGATKPKRVMPKGRPFQPGKSGNPAGRKPVLADIRAEFLGNVPTVLRHLLVVALSNRNATGVAAAREFLDRVTGKAPQPVVGERGAEPININAPDLVAALRKYVGQDTEEGESE